ncbi:MAG: GNAT family N-acetyltransferase [Clostridia bacterium]|nr:GNAT family N-acetyltransferase [Clostridia bacterium]
MIHLEKIDYRNIWDIIKLSLPEPQQGFVAGNGISLAQAYAVRDSETKAFPFAIYDDDTPVGFLMIGFNEAATYGEDEEPPRVLSGNYGFWRMMIDRKYQRKGFGREAVRQALAFVRTWPCGRAEYCALSYKPDNTVAAKLCHSFGFVENGEKDHDEIVAVLKL